MAVFVTVCTDSYQRCSTNKPQYGGKCEQMLGTSGSKISIMHTEPMTLAVPKMTAVWRISRSFCFNRSHTSKHSTLTCCYTNICCWDSHVSHGRWQNAQRFTEKQTNKLGLTTRISNNISVLCIFKAYFGIKSSDNLYTQFSLMTKCQFCFSSHSFVWMWYCFIWIKDPYTKIIVLHAIQYS